MVCAYTRPRYQRSVYRTIGPLVYNIFGCLILICELIFKKKIAALLKTFGMKMDDMIPSVSRCFRTR